MMLELFIALNLGFKKRINLIRTLKISQIVEYNFFNMLYKMTLRPQLVVLLQAVGTT